MSGATGMEAKIFDGRLTDCPLCGSGHIGRYDVDYTGKTIDRCRTCGIKFLNPQYTDEYLEAYYSRYIGPVESQKTEQFARDNRWRYMVNEYNLSLIEQRIAPGEFLSVGCGDGLELEVAKARGWNVRGFDVAPETASAVSKRLKTEVLSGNFVKAPYVPGSLDCVYVHHVLEHLKDPQEYLRKIHEILRPSGILFVACPNNGSISQVFKTFVGKIGLKKRRGKHYDTWHHLFYYSPSSLAGILRRHYGFEVTDVRCGFGDKTRQFSEARINSGISWSRWNRFLPWLNDVFVILAEKV